VRNPRWRPPKDVAVGRAVNETPARLIRDTETAIMRRTWTENDEGSKSQRRGKIHDQ